MCKHKDRDTQKIPGGHIEKGETPDIAAKRELFEETGSTEFELTPDFKYSFEINGKKTFSIMYHFSQANKFPFTYYNKHVIYRGKNTIPFSSFKSSICKI